MDERASKSKKYHVEINQAYGPVTGDYARVEQHFHVDKPPPLPISREELLIAIRQAGAELCTYPHRIAGIHIDRAEVDEIVEWALNTEPKQRLGMVLDQPGGGKTVVMRDVLKRLEETGVPVLAIKADFLSGIKTSGDLAERLGLPATVEECARSLVTEGPFVVLLDQLDALSLALSRDQATLDVMLTTLARLRDLEGVRIVASCRTFDLNHDPRLSTVQVDHKFRLQPLTEEQVNDVLQALGIDPARLLPGHRELLTVPLHLKVYARVVAGDAPLQTPESFRTLQELYEALWRKRIEVVPPDTPAPKERVASVYKLVDAMQGNRQLTAPVGALDEYPEATSYLEREGFIQREGSNWLFFHQTLFDYCYARRFVAQGRSLSQEILSGPQGLFERSQMVQVLAYLRDADGRAYRRELKTLLFADDLHLHLQLLLIGWLGSLPNPTTDELHIARRLMQDADDQVLFLQAAGGNVDWFDLLNEDVLPALLRTDDERLIDVLVRYLSTLIQHRTDPVLADLKPHLGESEAWDARIASCLSQLEDWRSDEALDILCDLLQRGRTVRGGWLCFHNLAESNPAAGCRALRAYLDHRIEAFLAQKEAENQSVEADSRVRYRKYLPGSLKGDQALLDKHIVGEVMKRAVQVCPEKVIEHLLPWFVDAVMILTEPRERDDCYPSDSFFAWRWYGDHISEGALFSLQTAKALRHLASEQPARFRTIAAHLVEVESLAVQRVLAQAYLADAEAYAEDIFQYLTNDLRRLSIGEELEDPHYDSGRLYGAAFHHLDPKRRGVLEQLILDLRPEWEQRRLGRQGATQLHFLKNVPPEMLSETARRRLQELERKFPNFQVRPPQGSVGGFVGSPITEVAQSKMSDEDWLSAMRKYDDSGYEHPDFLKGGVRQLASDFSKQVKADAKRFYRLAQRFDETISPYYVRATISGVADSDAPAGWLFDLVRQFLHRIEGESRRVVCDALEKRAEAGIPDDILDVMTDWALYDPNPVKELRQIPAGSGQPYYGGDPYSSGINSNRGRATLAVCRCALLREPPQVERIFQLLEQAADDPSTAVRACVIERLGPMLNEDDGRTLAVFERTLDGHPKLLQSPLVHRFLYWTYREHFPQTRLIVKVLLSNDDDATRQAGARLVCLAAFQYAEAEKLTEQVMRGDVAMRRGASQVYAHNLGDQDVGNVCQERLLQLMHDPDEQVRNHVGECFQYLRAEHLDRLQPFIEQFLTSPSLMNGARHLVESLASLAPDAPDLALMVTEHVLGAAGSEVTDIRTAAAMMEHDLVRLPLTVYTHSFDPGVKSRAMGLFERMLELGSRSAHRALEDWDRR